jgi:hypothetical protein
MLVESFDIAVEGEIDCFDQDSSFVGVDGYSGIFVEYLIQVMSRVHLFHVMIWLTWSSVLYLNPHMTFGCTQQ